MPRSTVDNSKETTPSLNREVIFATALQIADSEGFENLSARKLAASLGKTAMSLYRHAGSMEEIRMGAIALAYREVDCDPIPGERWDDTLRRTTASIRQVNLKHAKARLSTYSGHAWGPALHEHTTRIQTLHREQGIPDEILTKTWRIIDAFLSGFMQNELAELERIEDLEPVDAPNWQETVQGAYSDEAFHDGLEIILAGLRELSQPYQCDWRTPFRSKDLP